MFYSKFEVERKWIIETGRVQLNHVKLEQTKLNYKIHNTNG